MSVGRSVGFVFGRCVDDVPRARPKPGLVGRSLHWIGLDAKSVREETEIKKKLWVQGLMGDDLFWYKTTQHNSTIMVPDRNWQKKVSIS